MLSLDQFGSFHLLGSRALVPKLRLGTRGTEGTVYGQLTTNSQLSTTSARSPSPPFPGSPSAARMPWCTTRFRDNGGEPPRIGSRRRRGGACGGRIRRCCSLSPPADC